MAISINHQEAEKVLLAAFRKRCSKNDGISKRIETILNGTHKTYKYILVNGILANGDYSVIAHKVNQSGASSKEVGDIDIYKDGIFKYAIEVKDKNFTSQDITHAFDKIIKNSGEKGQFIFGPNANHIWSDVRPTLKTYASKGFFTFFMGIFQYSRIMLFKIGTLNKQAFVDTLINAVNEINAKAETREWIQELLKKLN